MNGTNFGDGFGNGKRDGVLDTYLGEDPDVEYQAYLEGQEAYNTGKPREVCPYAMGKCRSEWLRGYDVGAWKRDHMGGYQ